MRHASPATSDSVTKGDETMFRPGCLAASHHGLALLSWLLVSTIAVTGTEADTSSKAMCLTFNRPVRLPGVALEAGTYIFEMGGASVVRVSSRDRHIVHYAGLTYGVERPAGMRRDQRVSFGAAPETMSPPIMIWWPSDETQGRQFIYRK